MMITSRPHLLTAACRASAAETRTHGAGRAAAWTRGPAREVWEPRNRGTSSCRNDLTMGTESRKVHLAPRGRERRKAGLDPGSHQSKACVGLRVLVTSALNR